MSLDWDIAATETQAVLQKLSQLPQELMPYWYL